MSCEYPGDPYCAETWTNETEWSVSFIPQGPTAYDAWSLGEWALGLWENFGIDINAEYGVSFGWWGDSPPPVRTQGPVEVPPPAPVNPIQPVDVPAALTPRTAAELEEPAPRRPSLPGSPGEEDQGPPHSFGMWGQSFTTWLD